MAKKKMILCDTNIFIEVSLNNPVITAQFEELENKELVAINPIIIAELYAGARNKTAFLRLKRQLKNYKNYLIDDAVSKKFMELIDSFALSHNLKAPDGLIASTAIAYSISLWTLNVSDFVFIDELQLYQP